MLVYAMFGLAAATALGLVFVKAPYGRHLRAGWGPTLPSRAGWMIMESPAVFAFAAFYFTGRHWDRAASLALFALWQAHYVHRTLIFPLAMRATGKRMPVAIV